MKYSLTVLIALAMMSPALAQQSEYIQDHEPSSETNSVPEDKPVESVEESGVVNDPITAASRPTSDVRPQIDTSRLVSTDPNVVQAASPNMESRSAVEQTMAPANPTPDNTDSVPKQPDGNDVPQQSSVAAAARSSGLDMTVISAGIFVILLGALLLALLFARARKKPKVRKRSREETQLYQERDYSSFDEQVKKRLDELKR